MRGRLLLALGALLGPVPVPWASYGGQPVPAAEGRSLAYFTAALPGLVSECSGVLVGRRHVLTAAHCLRDEATGRRLEVIGREVRVGTPPGRAIVRRVLRAAVHPRFRSRAPRGGWDLAVLTLDRAVPRRPAALATRAEEEDLARPPARALGQGFGVTRAGAPPGPRAARRVRLEVLSPFNCVSPGRAPRFARTFVCAAWPTAGVCAGDSGGPLSVPGRDGRARVFAVASLAVVQSPCREVVGIFARVVPARAWIASRVGGLPRG